MASYEQQFCEFVQRKGPWLRRLAVQLCGDWQLAQDVTQDTWVKLYAKWPRLRQHDDGSLSNYVRKTVTSIVIDNSRRPCWKRERRVAELPTVAVWDPDAAEAVAVRWALVQLPPKQRAAVIHRVMEQLSVNETAAILNCSSESVRSQVSRGLQRLRSLLGDTPQDPQLIGGAT